MVVAADIERVLDRIPIMSIRIADPARHEKILSFLTNVMSSSGSCFLLELNIIGCLKAMPI